MLTKEERSAIAERLDRCEGLGELYYAVIGEELPTITSYEQDIDALFTRLNELCDTSNMIELPLDKDGEVIKVGDTVYDKDGEKGKVGGYYYNNGTCKIIIPYGQNGCYINVHPNEITHKKPVTIASINEQLRHVLDKGHMSSWSMAKLFDIADQLEMLSDSDD
nr:MAG TPA: hypothetical protein [Caudoviricetes sp.]